MKGLMLQFRFQLGQLRQRILQSPILNSHTHLTSQRGQQPSLGLGEQLRVVDRVCHDDDAVLFATCGHRGDHGRSDREPAIAGGRCQRPGAANDKRPLRLARLVPDQTPTVQVDRVHCLAVVTRADDRAKTTMVTKFQNDFTELRLKHVTGMRRGRNQGVLELWRGVQVPRRFIESLESPPLEPRRRVGAKPGKERERRDRGKGGRPRRGQ